jgi:hypothetical protein
MKDYYKTVELRGKERREKKKGKRKERKKREKRSLKMGRGAESKFVSRKEEIHNKYRT